MLWKGLSASISFLLITLFIPCLNSSTKALFSYLLPLDALLNSCTNFSIILDPSSTLFSSVTFSDLLSSFLHFFFNSAKILLLLQIIIFPTFKSSSIFSFQTSTDLPCTYVKIHYICFSTDFSLILILI